MDGRVEDEHDEFIIVRTSADDRPTLTYWDNSHELRWTKPTNTYFPYILVLIYNNCIVFDVDSNSSTNSLDFLKNNKLHEIYQTGKNMGSLLKLFGSKTNLKIDKIRKNVVKKLTNEGDNPFSAKTYSFLHLRYKKYTYYTCKRIIIKKYKKITFFNFSAAIGLLIALADDYSDASTAVSEIYSQSSALLLEVLVEKYGLFKHFEGLRNYMLWGRGDFYTYIVYKLEYLNPSLWRIFVLNRACVVFWF